MIVLITGSRELVGPSIVHRGLAEFLGYYAGAVPPYSDHFKSSWVFRCGDARGVDLYARDWLRREGYTVDVFCASSENHTRLLLLNRTLQQPLHSVVLASDWQRDGRKAGHLRNVAMIEGVGGDDRADVCVKFWDGSSPGTRDCAEAAERAGVEVVDGVVPGA